MPTIELSGLISVLVAAVSLLCAARLQQMMAPHVHLSAGLLRFTGLILLAVGSAGMCLVAGGPLSALAGLILAVIWARVAIAYRDNQRRNLLAALALAIDKQMPLARMALAFSDEQEGGFAWRVRRFAGRLTDGM